MTVLLDGDIVIVTGAGRGLGREYALDLARRGGTVVVNDIGQDAGLRTADAVVSEIEQAGGRAVADYRRVDNATEAAALVQDIAVRFGRVDALIHNAGFLRNRSIGKMTLDDVDDVLAVHLRAAFHLAVPCFKQMRGQGYGRIVLVTSAVGLLGGFGQANYAAAKAGVVGLVRSLAYEGRPHGIQANALAPLANTAMTEAALGELAANFDPALVAPMASYLSSRSCRLSGEILSAGAGRFSSFFVGATEGWKADTGALVTAEDVEQHIDEIRDKRSFLVFEDAWSEIQWLSERIAHAAT